MRRSTVWEIIFWFAIIVIAVWIILKASGLIGSPIWIEMIPYTGALFAAGAAFQILKDTKNKVDILNKRMDRIGTGLTKLEIEFKHMEKDIEKIK